MAAPSSKTMFNYFTKLPSKLGAVDENPRRSAPIYNKQHVEDFQARLNSFDAELANITSSANYILSIRTAQHQPFKLVKKPRGPLRAKLLQFHEDVRPPYFGTWQKESKIVTGRRPYGLDNEAFEYDVDSEAEWDIGGPGESLKGDDSEDEEELDDYEIDMKTFVPHGYVSDDEVDLNSDNEENHDSANRSIDVDCDAENDSNSDVKIVSEVKVRQPDQQCAPPVKQTPKMEIKPITIGLNFEESSSLSETKMHFLRNFQGVSCG